MYLDSSKFLIKMLWNKFRLEYSIKMVATHIWSTINVKK